MRGAPGVKRITVRSAGPKKTRRLGGGRGLRGTLRYTMTDQDRATSESALARSLGTFALAAGIVNVTIGGGIFRLPADMAGQLGAMAPLAYLLCAVAMGLIVL
jgi:hypothetical protein